MKKNSSLLLMPLMVLGLSGCMPDSLTKYKEDPVLPVVVPTVAGVTNFTQIEYFQITNETANVNYLLHRDQSTLTSSADPTCRVQKSYITTVSDGIANGVVPYNTDGVVGSQADITCILNANELDLYTQGVKLKLQVPAGICNYVYYDNYHFYEYQIRNSTIDGLSYTDVKNVSGDLCTDLPADSTGVKPDCSGDYTDNEGPNCDSGYIQHHTTTRTWTGVCSQPLIATQAACVATNTWSAGVCSNPALLSQAACEATNTWTCTNFTSSTVTDNEECGGGPGACMNGPAVATQPLDTNSLIPMAVLREAITGFEQAWSFSSPVSKGHITNRYLANYTSQCTDTAVTELDTSLTPRNVKNKYSDEMGGTTDNLTSFANDVQNGVGITTNDLYHDPLKGGNPFYTYMCLDEDYEVIGRIRVLVRDWDVRFVATADSQLLGQTNDRTKMDRAGLEPGNITWYNDKTDWDDHTVGTCSAGGYTSRRMCEYNGNTWNVTNSCDIDDGALFTFPSTPGNPGL